MATEHTPNYNLDLYAGTDKPNLRDQYNAAMGKIDTQMKTNADGITNANANVITLQTQVKQNTNDIAALESTVETHGTQIAALESTVETHGTQIASVETDVTQLKTQMGTANTNIESLESTTADLDSQIKSLNTEVDGKAPTDHSSTATTFGLGSGSEYGHVKLSDAAGSTNVNNGTAATPLAVQNAMNTVETKNSLDGFDVQVITSGFLDPRISLGSGGWVKLITHNGAGSVNINELRVNNQTPDITYVPIIDLADYGFQFTGTDYVLNNVVMTTDAMNVRMLRIIRGSDGNPQLQIQIPNNTNWTFTGQLTFIYTTAGARMLSEGIMPLAEDADIKYILG